MPRSRSEAVAINTGANIAMSFTSQLMNFVLRTVFTYALIKQYQSINGIFAPIMSVLTLADLGIANAIAFALYKPLRENNHARVAALMHFYKNAYRVVAGSIVLLGCCLLPFLNFIVMPEKYPEIQESFYLIFALFVIDSASSYLLVYKSTLLTAGQKRYMISPISIGFAMGRAAVQSVLLLVFHNYILYLAVGIVENLLRNYIVSRTADRAYPNVKDFPDARLKKGEAGALFKDVYALALYKVNGVVSIATNSLVINRMFEQGGDTIANLAWYRTIITTVDNIVNQFFNGMLPSLGNLATEADEQRQLRVFHTLLFITFWCTCFCTTSFLVLIDPFIQHVWLDASYLEPKIILLALLIDYYTFAMMRPLNTFRNANGLFVQGKYRPVAMTVINVALSIALARPLDVFGVLIATTIARVATSFWFEPMLVYRNVFHQKTGDYWRRYAAYFGITALSCAGTYFLAGALDTGSHMLNFIIKMALCVIIPNGLIVLLYHKTPEFSEFTERVLALLSKAVASIKAKARRASA